VVLEGKKLSMKGGGGEGAAVQRLWCAWLGRRRGGGTFEELGHTRRSGGGELLSMGIGEKIRGGVGIRERGGRGGI